MIARPTFAVVGPDENDNYSVEMTPPPNPPVLLSGYGMVDSQAASYPVFASFPDVESAQAQATALTEAVAAVVMALNHQPENRTDDEITLTFRF